MKARILALSLLILALPLACEDKVPEPEGTPRTEDTGTKFVAPKELVKEDVEVGKGTAAKEGDKVKVHYTGRLLKNGVKFDSSVGEGKQPFEFTIGEGGVIKGWDQGVVGMKPGGKRKLKIPADLAYGSKGKPPKIGKNEPLGFDIELIEIVADEPDAGAGGSGGGAAQ